MKNLAAFLVGLFIAAALILPTAAKAAISVIPDVPGLSGGGYTPSLGQLQGTQAWPSGSYTPATKTFFGTGTTSIGGKPLSIPVKIPLASTAGALAKNAMKLNPWAIAGTMAAGWLIDKGMEWSESEGTWTKAQPVYEFAVQSGVSCSTAWNPTVTGFYTGVNCNAWQGEYMNCDGNGITAQCAPGEPNSGVWYTWNRRVAGSGQPVAATDPDWDNLPDPTDDPGVAGELPGAAYMPHGAPVGKPQYQNGNYPLGEPYKAPDGSTVQPMASVTNNTTNNSTTNNYNNSVNVSTYNVTTHNAAGEPVANPTPEPTDEKQDFCEKNPKAIGCAELGTPPAGEDMPRSEIPLSFTPVDIGGNASCPAPNSVSAFGQTFALEYDSACTYASGIKPVVIAIGYLTALFIIFGAPRTAQS